MLRHYQEKAKTVDYPIWCDLLYADAAVLMLKNKIHRIPVVNDEMQVIGKCSFLFVNVFTVRSGMVASLVGTHCRPSLHYMNLCSKFSNQES